MTYEVKNRSGQGRPLVPPVPLSALRAYEALLRKIPVSDLPELPLAEIAGIGYVALQANEITQRQLERALAGGYSGGVARAHGKDWFVFPLQLYFAWRISEVRRLRRESSAKERTTYRPLSVAAKAAILEESRPRFSSIQSSEDGRAKHQS